MSHLMRPQRYNVQAIGENRHAESRLQTPHRRAGLIWGTSVITAATYYQPLPISTLVDHASTYDRHDVVVTGTVKGFATFTDTEGKKYLLFHLCDHLAKCVHVYAWGQSHVIDGASKTVRGTFWMTRSVDRHTVHNELEAAEGSP